MTVEEMKFRVEKLTAEVARLDKMADDDTISDQEFDRLTHKANELSAECGRLQKKNRLSIRKNSHTGF